MNFRRELSAVVLTISMLLTLACSFVGLTAGRAQAQEAASTIPPTMVILDASGSMLADDAGGQTRMDAAKAATSKFAGTVAEESSVGLMAYGTEVGNSPEEREAGCQDITTLLPVGAGNAGKIPGEVDKVQASGHTPMGPALRQAAEELPKEGPRSIVLVSDGEDTCAPPPVCEVAKELKQQGIDLVINTVGFLVDPAARAELQCIAEAGGGQYLDAQDSDSLADSMKTLATRNARTAQTSAAEIQGGDSPTSATQVPADVETFSTKLREKVPEDQRSINNLEGDGAEYFSVPYAAGERVTVSAATVPGATSGSTLMDPDVGNFSLEIHLDDANCFLTNDFGNGILDANGPFFASITTKQAKGNCKSGELVFSVTREGGPFKGKEIPAEVTIKRFAQEDLEGVPQAFSSDDKSLDTPPATPKPEDAKKVTPGTWFDDATELSADGIDSVTADIVPGEAHVYKIKSDYGQQLRGAVKLLDVPEELELGNVSGLDITTLNSARQVAGEDENQSVNEHLIGEEKTFGNAARINYRNLATEDDDLPDDYNARKAWLDGEQYIVVFFNDSWGAGESRDVSEDQNVPITYQLTTELAGEKIPGPAFGQVTHRAPSDKSSTSAQEAPANQADKSDDAKDTETDQASDIGSFFEDINMLWLSIGAILLAVIVGVIIAVSRQSR